MAVSAAQKTERLEVRITPEQKDLFQRAAAIEGETLSEFVTASAQQAAELAIREHEVLKLTARESRAFVEALLHPSEPNAALRAAAAHYQRVMAEH